MLQKAAIPPIIIRQLTREARAPLLRPPLFRLRRRGGRYRVVATSLDPRYYMQSTPLRHLSHYCHSHRRRGILFQTEGDLFPLYVLNIPELIIFAEYLWANDHHTAQSVSRLIPPRRMCTTCGLAGTSAYKNILHVNDNFNDNFDGSAIYCLVYINCLVPHRLSTFDRGAIAGRYNASYIGADACLTL